MIIEIIPNELILAKENDKWIARNKRLNKKLDINNRLTIKMLEEISQDGDIRVDDISSKDWMFYVQFILVTLLTNIEKGEE